MAGLDGLEDENSEIEIEESRGLSEENFKALTPTQQIKYIKEHPHSKYGKDPKWLKRAKMLKTKMLNAKKAKVASTPVKNPSVKKLIKQKEKALKIAKQRDGSFFNGPGTKRIHTKRTQKQLQKEIDELKKSLLKPVKAVKPADKVGNTTKTPSNSNNRYGNYKYVTDPKEIKKLMPKGVDYTVNKDGTVDIHGDIKNFDNLIDGKGHFKVKFGKVGDFDCSNCDNLTSLEGAPKEVRWNFSCAGCDKLTSLKGAPEKVFGDFNCSKTNITSLKGAPEAIWGDFSCNFCRLTSLKGAPRKVKSFNCNSPSLKSLEGAPEKVGEYIAVIEGFEKQLKKKYGDDKDILSYTRDGYLLRY